MARHVFLSFVEEDLDLVNLFRGQAKNANNDLEFDDYSVKEPYNSTNADYIKQQIRSKLDNVSVTVCLIGHSTHKSDWVDWEIIASSAKEKGLVGVRLHSSQNDISPPSLIQQGGTIVNWKIDDVINAIEKAAG
ncbi:TIR domain-containing protein [Nitrosopumilus sp.]|uniref:TIR domain-containing protein n=1 Tax=Nitrosopumilus sp. TaxID=2024843 RepID=UPI00261A0BFE|nr:TIR domain-containing protein [Nitrosopumilus sp.]